MHEITRLDNYADYNELKRDIKKDRLATRRSLKQFFNTFGDKHEWLAEKIVKTLVHALAEEDLPPRDKRFFQALLYSRPEFTNPHLIGGLNVGHKSKAGGEQRAKAIKQLLRRSQFANHQGTANNLIAALANPQSVRGAVEVLSGRNHATQATSNNLIAALADPQSVRGAVEVLSGPAYANRDTVNFLVSSTSSRNERRAGACIDILENIAARPDIRPFLEEILRKNQSYAVFTGGQRAFGLSDTARKEIRRLLRPGA